MSGLIGPLAVIGGLVLIIIVALGVPVRRREAVADRRRRGGRKPWTGVLAPTRDRDYVPGVLLLVVALWQIAGLIAANATEAAARGQLVPLVVLCAIIAAGYSLRPDLVGAGLGLAGAVTLILNRLGADTCQVFTAEQNQLFLVVAVITAAILIGLRSAITPLTSATRYLAGPVNPIYSVGRPRPVGRGAATLLALVGMLGLVDLATRPAGLVGMQEWGSWQVGGVLVAMALVVAAAIVWMPSFTLSVLGIGVVGADLAVNVLGGGCESWTIRFTCLFGLLITNRLATAIR